MALYLIGATALCALAAVASSQEVIWLDDLEMKAAAVTGSLSGIGELRCRSTGFNYRLLDAEAFAKVFKDPSRRGNATVFSVETLKGDKPSAGAECSAKRFVAKQAGPYHELDLLFGGCDVTWGTNAAGNQFEYSGALLITTRVYYSPTVHRDFKVRQPYRCEGPNVASPPIEAVDYVDTITDLDAIGGNFSVNIKVTQSSTILSEYNNIQVPTQVVTLEFELYETDKALYEMLVDECWATVDEDSTSNIRYPIITSKNCLTDPMFADHTVGQSPYTINLAAFEFGGIELGDMNLHCKVNICRLTSSDQRCTRSSCPHGRNLRKSIAPRDGPYPKLIGSILKYKSDVPPRVKIVNGRPSKV